MLAANLLLLRRTLAPVDRLVERMRTVDLLRPGQRLAEEGGVEVVEVVRAFNQMLDRLETERRESSRRVLAAQEAERLRIARGLHDEVGQVLTGVLLQLDSLADADPDSRRRRTDEARDAIRHALEEVRRIAHELRPELLEHLGLVAALTELARTFADQSGLDDRAPIRRRPAPPLRGLRARHLPRRPGEPHERRPPRAGEPRRADARARGRQRRPARDRQRPRHGRGRRRRRARAASAGCASVPSSSAARSPSSPAADGGVEIRLEVPAEAD